jgi:hypothetical protein
MLIRNRFLNYISCAVMSRFRQIIRKYKQNRKFNYKQYNFL